MFTKNRIYIQQNNFSPFFWSFLKLAAKKIRPRYNRDFDQKWPQVADLHENTFLCTIFN